MWSLRGNQLCQRWQSKTPSTAHKSHLSPSDHTPKRHWLYAYPRATLPLLWTQGKSILSPDSALSMCQSRVQSCKLRAIFSFFQPRQQGSA